MKRIFDKKYWDSTLVKGVLGVFVFQILYIFIYTVLISDFKPLFFLAKNGYVSLYVIITMVISAVQYIFCGYLLMLARNQKENLKEKNLVLSVLIFLIMFGSYLGVTIFQRIFIYRDIYTYYISFNIPLLRSLKFLDLNMIMKNIYLLISTFLPPVGIYFGGQLRLKEISKEDIHG